MGNVGAVQTKEWRKDEYIDWLWYVFELSILYFGDHLLNLKVMLEFVGINIALRSNQSVHLI